MQAHATLRHVPAWKSDPIAAATETLASWQGLVLVSLRKPQLDLLPTRRHFRDRPFG